MVRIVLYSRRHSSSAAVDEWRLLQLMNVVCCLQKKTCKRFWKNNNTVLADIYRTSFMDEDPDYPGVCDYDDEDYLRDDD